jgi:hypothetical protein
MLVIRYHNAGQYHILKRVSRFKCVKEQQFWNEKQSSIAWTKQLTTDPICKTIATILSRNLCQFTVQYEK